MAYIVLALGVLMSLVGLGAMATGYPVIEVERGWATVIAGAVLLSGGLVTAALGIVVRQLVGLKGSLQLPAFSSQGSPRAEAPAVAPQAMSIPAPPAPPAMQAPAARPSIGAVPAIATPVAAAAAFAPERAREPDAAHDYLAAAPVADPEHEPAEAHETPEPSYEHAAEETPAEAHEAEETYEAFEPEAAAAAHEAPHHAEPEPAPAQEHGQPLHSEAWLDQAFQAFDYEMMGGHPHAGGEPASHPEPEPRGAEAAHEAPIEPEGSPPEPAAEHEAEPHEELLHQEAPHEEAPHEEEPHEEEPHEAFEHEGVHTDIHADTYEAGQAAAADAPATAHEAPSNLAVIGRYDSDGTSYVMYSDGSIEAQSEAGVYRFGSMAELKAFIEG